MDYVISMVHIVYRFLTKIAQVQQIQIWMVINRNIETVYLSNKIELRDNNVTNPHFANSNNTFQHISFRLSKTKQEKKKSTKFKEDRWKAGKILL